MLKTLDFVLMIAMTAAAAVTYTIKHRAELKLADVSRLEAEIKLEKDTIELLRADWALLSQPGRLERLSMQYAEELKLQPTESTSLAQSSELPMLKSEVPPSEVADGDAAKTAVAPASDAAIKDLIDNQELTGAVED